MIEIDWRLPPAHLLATLLLLALVVLPLTACTEKGQAAENDGRSSKAEGRATDEETEQDDDDDLVPVETVLLTRGPIEAMLRFSTHLEAESAVQVFSQAARQVTELAVEEGDRVRRGQLLLRLQSDEQKSELRRIESQLQKARREYQRQQNLFAQELISEQAMNDATYEVDQLELALEDTERSLGYTEVRAPISGTVTARHVNLGDTITVNQLLFDLVDFSTIVARVFVPEQEMERLSVGQAARITSDSRPDEVHRGEVTRIAPVVDPRSGTVKVTVGIPQNQSLVPGMYVAVELVTATYDDALLIPKRALVFDQTLTYVYRLRDGRPPSAEKLRLEVALEDREHVMPAPGSDLEVGDEVVVAGQAGLKDGTEVRRASGVSDAVDSMEGAAATPDDVPDDASKDAAAGETA